MKMKMFRNLLIVVSLLAGTHRCFALDMAQQYPEPVCVAGQTEVRHMIIWHNTLSQAAVHYGVSQSTLQSINHIVDADLIYMGNTMVIPCGTGHRTTAIATNVRKVAPSPRIVIAVKDLLDEAPPAIAVEMPGPDMTVFNNVEPLYHAPDTTTEVTADVAPSAALPTADPAPVATSGVSSLKQGWYNITLDLSDIKAPIAAGMFPAVLLVNAGADAKWETVKNTGVKVVMNDNDTVTITTLLPTALTATSALAFIAYDEKGNEVGRHYLPAELLLKKVQLDEAQRIPAPDFAKFNFGDRKIAGVYTNLLHTTFKKQPTHKLANFTKTYGVLIAQNAAAVFVPALVVPTAIADAAFGARQLERHAQAKAAEQLKASQIATQP